MADAKISALTDGGGFKAGDALAVARSAASFRVSPIGVPVLVYRYTVIGSDKASIDTGVDTADAGSNDWTTGDLLEVLMYLRTDEAVVFSLVDAILNNDSGANYTRSNVQMTNTTAAGQSALSESAMRLNAAGASVAANDFSITRLEIPNFTGTVGNKIIQYQEGVIDDGTSANNRQLVGQYGYKSTSAITRLKIAPETALKKLKVGSQLLIYKRLSS